MASKTYLDLILSFRSELRLPFYKRHPWKFLIDNAAHVLLGYAAVWLYTHGWPLPSLALTAFLIGREQSQGGSEKLLGYDPHVDWLFYLIGGWLALS